MRIEHLTWSQVNAWRLAQHCLIQRLQPGDLVQAVRQTLGIQAQVMSAAELAIAERVDGLSPEKIQSALWQQRSLVKTWVIRQTLHLIAASDFSMYIAARRITDINWPAYFRHYGISREIVDKYLSICPEILSEEPLTRQQLAAAVGERIKSPELSDLLASKGWGTPLKPLAWRGELCFGPSNGQNVTFVRPSAWIGSWETIEPEAAMAAIARRYLQAYGPSLPDNFRIWWGTYIEPARQAFKSIADEILEVDVEGWHAYALRTSIEMMQNFEPAEVVNLLPLFDAYTFGLNRGQALEPLLSLSYQKQVYRPQGWISAVVLVGGMIKGIWESAIRRSKLYVAVKLFSEVSSGAREGITAEAERLGCFLNQPVLLEFK